MNDKQGKKFELKKPFFVRYLATTDFQPADARRMVPCFDEPHLKATWEMHIIRLGDKYHSLANMPIATKDVPV